MTNWNKAHNKINKILLRKISAGRVTQTVTVPA
jgi:hypothetical protein